MKCVKWTVVSVGLGLVVSLVSPVLVDISEVYVVDCIVVGTISSDRVAGEEVIAGGCVTTLSVSVVVLLVVTTVSPKEITVALDTMLVVGSWCFEVGSLAKKSFRFG